ncbi:MAG: Argininosuccinate lyase ArgH [Candidatus Methanohalarchaeum thermophilum]|uniref:Argininosuccinate lyase n=1 Tax=Methanohalarchaeum thermophilum TaxID=1903181 RepID=A0A1Q6DXM1_METT1|nr:MAG: Argininosuccinate lyase ArgH [Candidatus Methanohalarchaeum thermophilum]
MKEKDILGEKSEINLKAKQFISSLEFDEWIFEADVMVDMAHIIMLMERGIIPEKPGKKILEELEDVKYDDLSEEEDVHVAIETYLKNKLGEKVSGWLHTARSRNDEVATCIRIKSREEILETVNKLLKLNKALIKRVEEHKTTIMPGFTHLQHAEPTSLSHYFLSYIQSFNRDIDRLLDAYDRINKSPLGGGAFSSTSFDIDREMTADLLGFDEILENSMDAVSTRDYIHELISSLSNLITSISRIAEELILWSTKEFSYVDLPSEFTSTSSIMPQKKNPDVLEIIRAKAGSVQGNLNSVQTTLKALPYAYNRDLQEITPNLWKSLKSCQDSIYLIKEILKGMKINEGTLKEQSQTGFIGASELANYLVKNRDTPFRRAHNMVSQAIEKSKDYQEIAEFLNVEEDVVSDVMDPETIVQNKKPRGSPSKEKILESKSNLEKEIEENEEKLNERLNYLSQKREMLKNKKTEYIG